MDEWGGGRRGTVQKLVDELMGAVADTRQGQVRWLLESGVRASIDQDAV